MGSKANLIKQKKESTNLKRGAKGKKKKRRKKTKETLRDLWDNINQANICLMGVTEGEEIEKETKNLYEEIIVENFPNLRKEMDIQIQEAQ